MFNVHNSTTLYSIIYHFISVMCLAMVNGIKVKLVQALLLLTTVSVELLVVMYWLVRSC